MTATAALHAAASRNVTSAGMSADNGRRRISICDLPLGWHDFTEAGPSEFLDWPFVPKVETPHLTIHDIDFTICDRAGDLLRWPT